MEVDTLPNTVQNNTYRYNPNECNFIYIGKSNRRSSLIWWKCLSFV